MRIIDFLGSKLPLLGRKRPSSPFLFTYPEHHQVDYVVIEWGELDPEPGRDPQPGILDFRFGKTIPSDSPGGMDRVDWFSAYTQFPDDGSHHVKYTTVLPLIGLHTTEKAVPGLTACEINSQLLGKQLFRVYDQGAQNPCSVIVADDKMVTITLRHSGKYAAENSRIVACKVNEYLMLPSRHSKILYTLS